MKESRCHFVAVGYREEKRKNGSLTFPLLATCIPFDPSLVFVKAKLCIDIARFYVNLWHFKNIYFSPSFIKYATRFHFPDLILKILKPG